MENSLYFFVLLTAVEQAKVPMMPVINDTSTTFMMTFPGSAYPKIFIDLSKILKKAVITPVVSDTEAASFKQFLFLNNTFKISLYFLLSFYKCSAYAVLLGGYSGFSLKNSVSRMKGTVIKIASNLRKQVTSSLVLDESNRKPGITELNDSESIVDRAETKVTDVITSDLNQFIVTLLALFITKRYPNPQRIDPKRQVQGLSSERVVLSHTPATIVIEAIWQLNLRPFFVRHQFTGAAKRAWDIGNTRQLRVIRIVGVPKVLSTMVTMAAKLLLGMPLIKEARRQTEMMTNRQGLSLYQVQMRDFCASMVDNKILTYLSPQLLAILIKIVRYTWQISTFS